MNNARMRATARRAGRVTYNKDVIESWPACVDCDQPIRRNVDPPGRRGLYRVCGCPDVLWQAPPTGGPWERVEPDTV